MEALETLTPYISWCRGTILWVAEKIAGVANLDISNVETFLIIVISVWGGKKLFDLIYSNTEGRWGYWVLISGAIYLAIKYLGV